MKSYPKLYYKCGATEAALCSSIYVQIEETLRFSATKWYFEVSYKIIVHDFLDSGLLEL